MAKKPVKRRYVPRAERRAKAEQTEQLRETAAKLPKALGKQVHPDRRDAKGALLQAFEDLGGIKALVKWGRKNPTEFYRIWARLLPKDANIALTAMPLEDLLAQLAEADAQGATLDEAARQLGFSATEVVSGEVARSAATESADGATLQ